MSARRRRPAAPLRLVAAPPPVAPDPDHPARRHRPHVRSLAIASGKGGVGKSSLAANLAVALGRRGARVLLLDADLAQANLDLLLGLAPRYDLHDVLAGERTLDEIAVAGPPGVRLVPAASGPAEPVELDDYRRECLLRDLSTFDADTDLLVIDNASGVSPQVVSFCLAADDTLVVTTPEMPAFSDAYALIRRLHQAGVSRPPRLVVALAASAAEAEEAAASLRIVARRFLDLDLEYWGFIPDDPAVSQAVRRQQPVVLAFPESPAARAYVELAARVWPGPAPEDVEQRPARVKLQA